MNERTVKLKIRINTDNFMRGIHDAAHNMQRFGHALQGKSSPPRRPYRKDWSGMTAREYRAARRRYNRELNAWKKATR